MRELWSLLNMLMPELFRDSKLFDNWFYNKPAEEG
jgi:SNF2 family DNA or RNA helicase